MPTSRDVLVDTVTRAKTRVTVTRDPSTGLTLFKTVEDLQPTLRANELVREVHDKDQWKRNPAHITQVASIPSVVVAQLRDLGIWQDRKALLAWLSSSEARKFRTDNGRRLA